MFVRQPARQTSRSSPRRLQVRWIRLPLIRHWLASRLTWRWHGPLRNSLSRVRPWLAGCRVQADLASAVARAGGRNHCRTGNQQAGPAHTSPEPQRCSGLQAARAPSSAGGIATGRSGHWPHRVSFCAAALGRSPLHHGSELLAPAFGRLEEIPVTPNAALTPAAGAAVLAAGAVQRGETSGQCHGAPPGLQTVPSEPLGASTQTSSPWRRLLFSRPQLWRVFV